MYMLIKINFIALISQASHRSEFPKKKRIHLEHGEAGKMNSIIQFVAFFLRYTIDCILYKWLWPITHS